MVRQHVGAAFRVGVSVWLISMAVFSTRASGQDAALDVAVSLVLNGSFEDNTAGTNSYNLSNTQFTSFVHNTTAFGGSAELDLMTTADLYGLTPTDGQWKIGLHCKPDNSVDAISMNLLSPITAGASYSLLFDADCEKDFDPNNGAIQIGISNNPSVFGTLWFSGTANVSSWTTLGGSNLIAPVGGAYLTMRNDPAVARSWVHVDNVRLTGPVPEPASALGAVVVGALTAMRRRPNRAVID